MSERTLGLVKCRATAEHLGEILEAIKADADLRVVAEHHLMLPVVQAEQIYAEHVGRPYFAGLIASVVDGHVYALVLEGEGAIRVWRERLGATDPAKAAPETLRGRFGHNMPHNAFHGSDSPEAAAREIAILFPDLR